MRAHLVGLLGYAGSGKDCVGTILVRDYGFTRLAMADALKLEATALGWSGLKDDEGRRFLQNLGMARRVECGPDYWLRRVFAQHDPTTPTVITDCRYLNEIAAVRDRHGLIWRIDRPGTGPANDHISEREWTTAAPDAVILNDGTLADLERRVRTVIGARVL